MITNIRSWPFLALYPAELVKAKHELLYRVHKGFTLFKLWTVSALWYLQKFRPGNSIRELACERRRRRGVERAEQNLIMGANATRLLKIRR